MITKAAFLSLTAGFPLFAQTVLVDYDDGIAGNGVHDGSIGNGGFEDTDEANGRTIADLPFWQSWHNDSTGNGNSVDGPWLWDSSGEDPGNGDDNHTEVSGWQNTGSGFPRRFLGLVVPAETWTISQGDTFNLQFALRESTGMDDNDQVEVTAYAWDGTGAGLPASRSGFTEISRTTVATPNNGSWAQANLLFTATNPAFIGHQIAFRILVNSDGGTASRDEFAALDNFTLTVNTGTPSEKPNILWLVAEDMSPNLGCYGDANAISPNLDQFATRSFRYNHAWSNAPVCSAARSTLITGMYGNTIGVNFHRKSSNATPPDFLKFYPRLMQELGYYTSNNSKTDYNMSSPGGSAGWNANGGNAHWRNRPAGQPFLSVFNYGQTHEGNVNNNGTGPHNPNNLVLPECHPDIPSVRQQWANHYNDITNMDAAVQNRLNELTADGLADDTIVFFYSDHGSSMPGYKRYVGNRGQQVALLVHIPEKFAHLRPPGYSEGGNTDELVSFVDFAPTLLSLAGSQPPSWHHGRAFLGAHYEEAPAYLHGYADRFDERTWLARSVHDGRYVYIRNYRPDLPHGLHNEYAFAQTFIGEWQQMFHHGQLTPETAHHWTPQGAEELYDLHQDPDEVRNLAHSPTHQDIIDELRTAHLDFRDRFPDAGFLKEGILFDLKDSTGLSEYDLIRTSSHYPQDDLHTIMDLASFPDISAPAEITPFLSHAHPTIRHWGLIALKLKGRGTVRTFETEIFSLLSDSSHWVKNTAAQVLATHGSPANQITALNLLFNDGAGPAGNSQNERETLFSLTCLDELPYIPESHRQTINTLQNSTTWTKNHRRHMWYGYYEQYNNPLRRWRHLHGLNPYGLDDGKTSSSDGTPNLLKFAGNLAPDEGDLSQRIEHPYLLTNPESGEFTTSGLPSLIPNPDTGQLEFHFLRRLPQADSTNTNVRPTPNLSFIPEISNDLGHWTENEGAATVTPITSEWERVTLSLQPDNLNAFFRIKFWKN